MSAYFDIYQKNGTVVKPRLYKFFFRKGVVQKEFRTYSFVHLNALLESTKDVHFVMAGFLMVMGEIHSRR